MRSYLLSKSVVVACVAIFTSSGAISTPIDRAAKVWSFTNDVGMRVNGEARIGVSDQGGTEPAASFRGGWIEPVGGDRLKIPVKGDFSVAIRFSVAPEHFDMGKRREGVLWEWLGEGIGPKPARHFVSFEILNFGQISDNRYIGFWVNNCFLHTSILKLSGPGWHEAVLRVKQGQAEFLLNGQVWDTHDLNSTSRGVPPSSQTNATALAGNFCNIGNNQRRDRAFSGSIAWIAIWNEWLDDAAAAQASGVASLQKSRARPKDWGTNWMGFYNDEPELPEAYRRLYRDYVGFYQRALRDDIYFPRYHLTTPGFLTEPSASSYKRDAYHLFPHGVINWAGEIFGGGQRGGGHYWHHLMSRDLRQWKLMPFPEWPEPESGNMVEINGKAVSFPSRWPERGITQPAIPQFVTQTGRSYLEKWISTDPDLSAWRLEKYVSLPLPSSGIWPMNNFVFQHQGRWKMVTSYAGRARLFPHTEGLMELYHAKDGGLDEWEYKGVFYRGTHWASHHPQIYFIGDKAVMSSDHPIDTDVEYVVGRIEEEKFIREGGGFYEFGGQSGQWGQPITEPDGRVLRWSLIQGLVTPNSLVNDMIRRGWGRVYSLPREIGYRDGELSFEPARELEDLRIRQGYSVRGLQLRPGVPAMAPLAGDRGSIEVRCEIETGDSAISGILLKGASDDLVRVYHDAVRSVVGIDFKDSRTGGRRSLRSKVETPVKLKPGEKLELRLFFDRSVIELYANGLCTSARWYPDNPADIELGFYSEGGGARLAGADVWEIGTIWREYAPQDR